MNQIKIFLFRLTIRIFILGVLLLPGDCSRAFVFFFLDLRRLKNDIMNKADINCKIVIVLCCNSTFLFPVSVHIDLPHFATSFLCSSEESTVMNQLWLAYSVLTDFLCLFFQFFHHLKT